MSKGKTFTFIFLFFLFNILPFVSPRHTSFAKDEKEREETEQVKAQSDEPEVEVEDEVENDNESERKRDELRDRYVVAREEIHEQIAKKREEAIASGEANRETFRERIKEVTDEKRKELIEKTDTRITNRNTTLVDRAQLLADRMESILIRIEERIVSEPSLLDSGEVAEQLETAQQAVATFQEIIDQQAQVDYVFEIGEDDEPWGQYVKETLAVFREDATVMKEYFQTAKDEMIKLTRLIHTTLESSSDADSASQSDQAENL